MSDGAGGGTEGGSGHKIPVGSGAGWVGLGQRSEGGCGVAESVWSTTPLGGVTGHHRFMVPTSELMAESKDGER